MIAGRIVPGWPDPDDPLSLSAGTIYLPTRRAARALAALLAEAAAPVGAVLLPRLRPLGDTDEVEETLLFEALAGEPGLDELPPEVSPMRRRLALARLVQAWAASVDAAELRLDPREALLVPASPADALALADDLGALIDTLVIHGRDCDDLSRLTPERFDEYRRISSRFLEIAACHWPEQARQWGVMDAVERRHRMLVSEAGRMATAGSQAPVIVAGSTGSMPATAALIAAVSRLPRGAVVLPGLDPFLDDTAWALIPEHAGEPRSGHTGHPQAMLAKLLATIGVNREAVVRLGRPPPALLARESFLSEALRPAETTERWAERADSVPPSALEAAFEDIAVIEASDDREEALAIALVLRQALEQPDTRAALVTPDRRIGERVAAEMRRWGVIVDDSAGQPLARCDAGVLARLVAETAAARFAPSTLLALLDHPLCRLGLPRETVLRGRAALELGVLRGPALAPGLAALSDALEATIAAQADRDLSRRWPWPKRRLEAADWDAARTVVAALAKAFAGFPAPQGEPASLVAVVADHAGAVAAVLDAPAAVEAEPAPDPETLAIRGSSVQTQEALTLLRELFDEAEAAAAIQLAGRFADYPAFFAALASRVTLRRPDGGRARLHILGLLEARLIAADIVVLAGLDEKTWPPEARSDAFLNRSMRRALELPALERRLGQTAHDFVQALGAPRAVITRALKRGGDPTVASRLVQRMRAVAGDAVWEKALRRGHWWLVLARALDHPDGETRPARRPAPTVGNRFPQRLSISRIETLARDPYAIYAQYILGLDPLDPLAEPPGAALKGSLIHAVLGRFAAAHPTRLPADAQERLEDLARAAFEGSAELTRNPEIRGFWWPRLRRIACAAASWEAQRRRLAVRVLAEIDGELTIALPDGGQFTLVCRADRIELNTDGSLAILDFKTGAAPSTTDMIAGFSPQLTLEAAMAARGAFSGLPASASVAGLVHVKPMGHPQGFDEACFPNRNTRGIVIDALAREQLDALAGLIAAYRAGRALISRPYAEYAQRFSAYDHLARVREWSLTDAGDAEGEEGL